MSINILYLNILIALYRQLCYGLFTTKYITRNHHQHYREEKHIMDQDQDQELTVSCRNNESEKILVNRSTNVSSLKKKIIKKSQKRIFLTTSSTYKISNSTWEPENWKTILKNIEIMRGQYVAPVDTMGSDKCSDIGDNNSETMADDSLLAVKRFHTLVSLMLSSQTKDQTTYSAMRRLLKYGLTVDSMIAIDIDELGKMITPVSFWRTKAKNIKAAAQIIKNEYHSDIPHTIKSLCKLPGVGPKMGHLCMLFAWGITSGIGVDTHVHRIANRLGFVRTSKSKSDPETTRRCLESWLPKELWPHINHLLVGFGQTVCKAVSPNCGDCLNNMLCPSANIVTQKNKSINPIT